MSNFSEGMTFNVGPGTLRKACEMALEELDMIPIGSEGSMIFREKIRFDAFNPVTVEISIDHLDNGTELKLLGANDGIGPFQEHHVRSKIMELLSRIQLDMDRFEEKVPVNDTGEYARELQMLSNLHEKGLISDLEFHKAKETLLHRIN